ncbi:MAG: hypothetical protein KDB44_16630 [Mycobacterium sp.]|nr:hypothetical protein [Mycobacterium sp.]
MAYLDRRATTRIVGLALSMITLYAGASIVAASAISASSDFPLQPQCGPDPVTLIDPCADLSQPGVAADPAPQIPWDVIDSVLFA